MEKINLQSSQQPPVQQQPRSIAGVQPMGQRSSEAFVTSMKKTQTTTFKLLAVAGIAAVVLGIGTGYVAASAFGGSKGAQVVLTTGEDGGAATEAQSLKVGQVVGAKDASAFKDTVEGVVVAGGVEGEGSHHLVRPGGASQNVYLTSSAVDLKMFENHKVKVSGETFSGQKAGWLMDVARIEVVELNAELPDGAVKKAPAQVESD